MRRARGLLANLVLAIDQEKPPPEFAHRHVHAAEIFQPIHAHRLGPTRPRRFAKRLHAVFVCELGQMTIVVVRHAIGDGLAIIVEKALGDFGAAHQSPRQHRQVGPRVVATEKLELRQKFVRPVRVTILEAVGGDILQGLPGMRTGVLQIDFDHIFPLLVQCRSAQKVHRETISPLRRAGHCASGHAVSGADDRPRAFGNIPVELAIGPDF